MSARPLLVEWGLPDLAGSPFIISMHTQVGLSMGVTEPSQELAAFLWLVQPSEHYSLRWN